MLYPAIAFFIVGVMAAGFGFSGVSCTAAGIAAILFIISVVRFVFSVIWRLARRPNVPETVKYFADFKAAGR